MILGSGCRRQNGRSGYASRKSSHRSRRALGFCEPLDSSMTEMHVITAFWRQRSNVGNGVGDIVGNCEGILLGTKDLLGSKDTDGEALGSGFPSS
mmetsp:Transcript_12849/g.19913  ORF Transcript_12849/g.19913 Transcript_12849/m.19913 type:complete len:95 (-) Transcript_12849:1141-1425(-)